MDNGTVSNVTCDADGMLQSESHLHEITYVALTLFVSSLSALVASFLGLRRRQRIAVFTTV